MSTIAFPAVDVDLLDAHAAAHLELGEVFDACDTDVRLLFRHLQRRLTLEGLAHVQGVRPDLTRQLLLPPPRAFLTRAQQRRMRGVEAAFRHVDTRITLEQLGAVPSAIEPGTLQALHALFEGSDPSNVETNPGMFRLTPVGWQADANPYQPPPPGDVPGLVAEVLARADERSAPASVRAAWLTFTLLAIHPFVDGNGRACRAMYLLVASPELPLGLDWGILEQWTIARHSYAEMLRRGNPVPGWDPEHMSAEPFTAFSIAASIRGTELCIGRLTELARRYEARRGAGLSAAAAVVAGVIEYERSCTWDELITTGLPFEQLDDAVAELLARGAVRWAPRPASRRTIDDPAASALVLA